jgi:solute carrier family 31 (copper transporter), member 1
VPGFISRTWRITSTGMFAGSCIGVICLVFSLEFLRRLGKEYDKYLLRDHERQLYRRTTSGSSEEPLNNTDRSRDGKSVAVTGLQRHRHQQAFKPNMLQQSIRALLHMLQFGVAYFIMLLAMYYNGYVIICILIGALLGSFIFNWETLGATSR